MDTKISFKNTRARKTYVERQIEKGLFYRNKDGVVLSKEHPKNEAKNINSDIYSNVNWKDKKRRHYYVTEKMCRRYYDKPTNVLEVGAGTGQFAKMYINRFKPKSYTLYEHSPPMIKRIKKRFKKQDFTKINIKNKSFKNISKDKLSEYDCIIALEVFEHINWDREFLSLLDPKTWIFFSVPRIVAHLHVRSYLTPDSIIYRYKNILDVYEVREVKRIIHYKSKHNYPMIWSVVAKRKGK
jgi:2-polyprenyl-3-methyl-5-hydroxy-6-metoxy-1,4-benzoquinol methylase